MNLNTILLAAALTISIFNLNSRERIFENVGRNSQGREFGVPASAIDNYAKDHNLSREEAKRRIRLESNR